MVKPNGTEFVAELQQARIGYGDTPVFDALSLAIPRGKVTALCGPNGCGKSTALKAMRGLLPLSTGAALLNDAAVGGWSPRALAREVAMLGQTPSAPEDMVLADLVALGRYAHSTRFGGLSQDDRDAIARAIRETDLEALVERPIGSLSGGQLQRGWLAMILAQAAPVVFLDEPTNHLDIAHAADTLALVRRMVETGGRTVVIVLHDLNMAATVADRIVLFRGGEVAAEGEIAEVLTPDTLLTVFDLPCAVLTRPDSDLPLVVPMMRPCKS